MLESSDPKIEFVNYYGNTSLFALDRLSKLGELGNMSLLSIGSRMAHLADYLAIFRAVHHLTLATPRLPVAPEECRAKLVVHQVDFFEMKPLEVDCVISQAVFHCLNDTRYGNASTPSGFQKPYQGAAKLREIIGDKPVPVFVSVSINKEEGFFDNNMHLAHDKFVASFERAGFKLQEYFFDYVCGGIPQRPEYLDYEYRRSKKLPEPPAPPKGIRGLLSRNDDAMKQWVVGNYYFC